MEKFTFDYGKSAAKIASTFVILLLAVFSSSLSAQCPLGCNGKVQVSLNGNCEAIITPEMILEGEDPNCTTYSVDVLGPNEVPMGNTVDERHIGMTLKVRVNDGSSNSCWGYIVVEDKAPPVIDCPDTLAVVCYFNGIIPTPVATDNCDGIVPVEVVSDQVIDLNCEENDTLSAIRIIKYQAEDSQGNKSLICERVIEYDRIPLDSVIFPMNRDGIELDILEACGLWDLNDNDYPDPWVDVNGNGQFDTGETESGIPTTTDGYPIFPNRSYCEINATFHDKVVPICEKSFKVLRNWTLLDWCTTEVRDSFQIVKVLDTTPPNVVAPDDFEVQGYADPYDCDTDLDIPPPEQLIVDCTTLNYTVEFLLADGNGLPPINGLYETDNGVQRVVRIEQTRGDFPYFYRILNVPVGATWIRYTVTDDCGNVTEAFTEAFVIDNVPPNPVCDEHTVVTLTSEGYAKVFAKTFDDGSHDNCTEVGFEVRRLRDDLTPDTRCTSENAIFREYVEFCCADAGMEDLMVELRVWDDANGSGIFGDEVDIYEDTNDNGILGDVFQGIADRVIGTFSDNYNTCMVLIDVQDKIDPIIVCPPDLTVYCDGNFDDLSIFGTVVEGKENRMEFTLSDDILYDSDGPLIDGYAEDNCDVTISEDPNFNINSCRVGTIVRTFTAIDGGGRSSSCAQVITVVDHEEDFVINPPEDITLEGCQEAGTDPEDLKEYDTATFNYGYPIIEDDICSQYAMTYKDQVFNFVDSVCFKILRRWTVIDWCEYEQSRRTRGIWNYTQIIKVNDEDDPIIANTSNVEFCVFDEGCQGFIELVNGAEDCTPDEELVWRYEIDEFNDDNGGYDIEGFSNDASDIYPVGLHRITWYVEDMCGNLATTTYLFEVQDCKKPTPYCISEITTVVMPTTGAVTIWAKDFDRGATDNCPGHLRFSFVEPNANATNLDSSMTFICPVDEGEQELEIYVVDKANNYDFCRVTINIQVNHDCEDGDGEATAALSGRVTSATNDAVDAVSISLQNMNSSTMSYFETNGDGKYAFNEISSTTDYKVTAAKNDDVLNGVSTLDLVLIQRHILGIKEFDSAHKYIAADINNNGALSASDIITLRKVILGIYEEFPDNDSWRFVDASQELDMYDPYVFSEYIMVDENATNKGNNNFTGIKIGDIDQDAKANSRDKTTKARSGEFLTFILEDANFTDGEIVTIPFNASNFNDIVGYQMTLEYNDNTMEFVSVVGNGLNFTDQNLGLTQPGQINVSWNEAEGISIQDGEALFTLTFRAKTNDNIANALTLNSSITRAEAYHSNLEIADLGLTFSKDSNANVVLEQNRPNPFSDNTVINFVLPESAPATLTVFDITGKLLYKESKTFSAGKNAFTLDADKITADGIMYYQLESGNFKSTKKMIKINR